MERLQEFAFVQTGMVIATVAFFWMGAAFPVGIVRGARSGLKVLKTGMWLLVGGMTAVMVWSVVSGQMARFSSVFGLWELVEMFAFVFIFEFIVYFMAGRYLEDRAAEEAAAREETKKAEAEDA